MGNILCCIKKDDMESEKERMGLGGWSRLMIVANDGHLAHCVHFTNAGDDVNQTNSNGDSALSLAALNGHYDVVDHLIKQQANINTTNKSLGWSPLMIAAFNGNFKTCVLLTDSGADIHLISNEGDTALSLAARRGKYVVAQHLINLGADINTVKAQSQKDALLRYGSSVGDLTMCTNLFMSGAVTLNPALEDEELPLFISAKSGHYELSQWMIGEGADERKCLDPLLYCYAKYGDYQLCRNMLERGADPSYPGCLQIAIDLYHTDVAQLLIDHPKAKVNQVRKCDFQ